VNGLQGEVVSVDGNAPPNPRANQARARSEPDLDAVQDRHVRHAYVQTAFAAFGKAREASGDQGIGL